MRNKILIVDDSEINREFMGVILEDEYEIVEAENGREAFKIIEAQRNELAAVLLDIVMPEVDGITLLKLLHEKKYLEDFPVLVVTGETSLNLVAECFDYGISDFIRKPVNTDFVKERVGKLVELYAQKNNFKERLIKQNFMLKKQYKLLQRQALKLRQTNENIIDMLGAVIESRNLEDHGHVKRVKKFTEILARHMMEDYPEYELTEEKIGVIASASALHDVGKVMIPDSILLKPGKLTEDEDEYLKSHTIRGYEIIDNTVGVWNEQYARYGREITRYHHERYDGAGYPDGLKGDEIPVAAQIVSIADCYETLISEIVPKSAVPREKAYNMILQGECGVFSGKLLECFRKSKKEMEAYLDEEEKNKEEEEPAPKA